MLGAMSGRLATKDSRKAQVGQGDLYAKQHTIVREMALMDALMATTRYVNP
jgi:hypothetical protein